MSMRAAYNNVKIEGILAETELKYGSFTKNGSQVESIGGSIKVLVDQDVQGKHVSLEIPVHMFATKYKKDGGINPAYTSIETVMREFVSIAAAGNASQADKVRITNAKITMNEFPGQDGRIISQPRITTSFVSRVVGTFAPEATFAIECMISSMNRVTDKDGVEVDPAKLAINVVVPQYTAPGATVLNVDAVPLYAVSPNVIAGVESTWEPGNCYKVFGRLNFTSRTEEVLEEVAFGEPAKKVRTVNVNEFIVTGSSEALDSDFAWTVDEIKAGMAVRANKLEQMKNSKAEAKKTPAPVADKGPVDLGF